jgi:hypothetical protein
MNPYEPPPEEGKGAEPVRRSFRGIFREVMEALGLLATAFVVAGALLVVVTVCLHVIFSLQIVRE